MSHRDHKCEDLHACIAAARQSCKSLQSRAIRFLYSVLPSGFSFMPLHADCWVVANMSRSLVIMQPLQICRSISCISIQSGSEPTDGNFQPHPSWHYREDAKRLSLPMSNVMGQGSSPKPSDTSVARRNTGPNVDVIAASFGLVSHQSSWRKPRVPTTVNKRSMNDLEHYLGICHQGCVLYMFSVH